MHKWKHERKQCAQDHNQPQQSKKKTLLNGYRTQKFFGLVDGSDAFDTLCDYQKKKIREELKW